MDTQPFESSDTSAPAAGSETPGIPEAVLAAARDAPGHWIGVVDPEWTEERTPDEFAVLGEWQSDETGAVGEYRANPAYRPSPRVLGWPEPTDPVDAAAQRAATGYGSVETALEALAEADVTLVRGPDGGPLTAAGVDGAPVVLLFTSSAHAFMSASLRHDTVPARDLVRSLHDPATMLMVNPGAVAPLFVPADEVPGTTTSVTGTRTHTTGTAVVEHPGTSAVTSSADRTDSPSEPWPHATGRTP